MNVFGVRHMNPMRRAKRQTHKHILYRPQSSVNILG